MSNREFVSRKKPRPPVRATKEEYQWSTQSYSLPEIVGRFALPRVVRCNVSACSLLWENFSFDMKQPLLLHTSRRVRKVCARSLQHDPQTGEYGHYGPNIVIPEDYQGWFSIISEKDTDTTKAHTTLQTIVAAKTTHFLNTTTTPGLVQCPMIDGTFQYESRPLLAGEVFRVGRIFTDDISDKRAWKLSVPKKTKGKEVKKYVKCYDEKDTEIFVPISRTGRFYEISETRLAPGNTRCLRKISDLMSDKVLPQNVQLIYGELPALMCYFTGILQISKYFEEETVVAATLSEDTSMMFEIAVTSPVKYNITLNEAKFHGDDKYKEAIELCNNEFHNYISNMKLAFKLKPALIECDSDSSGLCMSELDDSDDISFTEQQFLGAKEIEMLSSVI